MGFGEGFQNAWTKGFWSFPCDRWGPPDSKGSVGAYFDRKRAGTVSLTSTVTPCIGGPLKEEKREGPV